VATLPPEVQHSLQVVADHKQRLISSSRNPALCAKPLNQINRFCVLKPGQLLVVGTSLEHVVLFEVSLNDAGDPVTFTEVVPTGGMAVAIRQGKVPLLEKDGQCAVLRAKPIGGKAVEMRYPAL
jgi:hypothetical protein